MDGLDINPAVPGRIDHIDIGTRSPGAGNFSSLKLNGLDVSALAAAAVVTIAGAGVVGQALTAALGSGWVATGYQWYRGGVAIAGATSANYTLVSADLSAPITVTAIGLSNSSSGVTITAGSGSATADFSAYIAVI